MNTVHEYEIEWMINKRPLLFDCQQLVVDYGDQAQQIVEAFEKKKMQKFMGCLNWHGVGSRWKIFLDWLVEQPSESLDKSDPKEIFTKFAQHLGRVISFRALSLTHDGYATIEKANSIYPSGRLKVHEDKIDKFVLEYGVRKICYARLYIGLGLMEFDPSLSLHDDGETAVCIASSYVAKDKKIHLMKLSVPKIEVCGYKLQDISDKSERWFQHNGIWFDGTEERTERYTLYEIPFYKERLQQLTIFESNAQVNEYLLPFKNSQREKYLSGNQ
eukprot:Phypoly_transcript_13396.p1 GENE.Phypoly_transcript_13396~~Phypoly_transcript_13396.p1  ORF type:complete len:273 (+),score=32.43 Phypoly_transcript_13396:211-1029(+)